MTGSGNWTLDLAALGEGATGLALLLVPALVGELLFGSALTGMAIPVARVAGIALISLALACWRSSPLAGMLAYSIAVTFYLAAIGLAGDFTGVLLWPAIALHGLLSLLLARAWLNVGLV